MLLDSHPTMHHSNIDFWFMFKNQIKHVHLNISGDEQTLHVNVRRQSVFFFGNFSLCVMLIRLILVTYHVTSSVT